jgi:hypothetical protein
MIWNTGLMCNKFFFLLNEGFRKKRVARQNVCHLVLSFVGPLHG